ncbi:MAG TPA: ribosome biogenesis GTPase Der [Acidobacteria bacterium]|nr:ribosome biogenesis GTPase Der [Acidobacteriota bacterium]
MATKRRRGLPSIVLAGRPNVGKSTLFNRITRSRKAIVTRTPGTTRDLVAQDTDWRGVTFRLVDSGGMFGASDDPLKLKVLERGQLGIDSADLIVFVVDAREGLVPPDLEVADLVRKVGVPVVLAVNKIDDRRARNRALEFYQLGFDAVIEVSAEHGTGSGDLLDVLVGLLQDKHPSRRVASSSPVDLTSESRETAVAIVGRPNVGKSSLVNRLLREDRVMVSERPGTTRDAIDELMFWRDRRFRIVDTAGIRRPGRVAKSGKIESVSVVVSKRAIQRADVVVLLVDAQEGLTDQDAAIVGAADKAGCGVIIAVNKWDLMKGIDEDGVRRFDELAKRHVKFVDYAPFLHISALTGERLPKLLEAIDRVSEARQRRIPTGKLNRFFGVVTATHPPVSPDRREVRILYSAQTAVAPPTFVCFTNVATRFHFSYVRFLTNRLRDAFGYEGSPIRLHVRRRQK